MADKDPWSDIKEETIPKPIRRKEWTEVVAGLLAIVMVPLFPLFGLYGALVSLSAHNILSFALAVLFMVVAGLSLFHALNGRHRLIWVVSGRKWIFLNTPIILPALSNSLNDRPTTDSNPISLTNSSLPR